MPSTPSLSASKAVPSKFVSFVKKFLIIKFVVCFTFFKKYLLEFIFKNFVNNKGRLYWPVERGEITSTYGKHQHHLVNTAIIDNNGVDITTSKNSSVRSVFSGKVTSVLIIPGAGKVVMISHGDYRTVYANLQEVFVKKGQNLKAKEDIGKLLAKSNGISEAHFEIWKISSSGMNTVNPSLWLSK